MPPKYKPGGKRFPPRETSKLLPKQVLSFPSSATSEQPVSSGLDQEAENQFELEVCWCIQQLQITLDSGKLGDKHSLEGIKTLKLLKSSTAPLIRKRQAMRSTFGDYRAKMSQDERKHGRYVSNFKFSASKLDTKKSVFLRKAAIDSAASDAVVGESGGGDNEEENKCKKTFVMSKEPSDVPFRFNFRVPECK